MRADLVLVSVDAPHLFPVYNPYSALVYGANSSDVSLVMASGETLVRGGKLTRLDMRGGEGAAAGADGAVYAECGRNTRTSFETARGKFEKDTNIPTHLKRANMD